MSFENQHAKMQDLRNTSSEAPLLVHTNSQEGEDIALKEISPEKGMRHAISVGHASNCDNKATHVALPCLLSYNSNELQNTKEIDHRKRCSEISESLPPQDISAMSVLSLLDSEGVLNSEMDTNM